MPLLSPPQSLISMIGPDTPNTFRANGAELAAWLIQYCGLQPEHWVLDVGCGVGRIALQLTNCISSQGAYRGFDLLSPCISWCQDNISVQRTNFQFLHADIFSPMYNPSGIKTPEDYQFPYFDELFDIVCLTSVFTHMLPAAVSHYVDEIRRVLKPRGRALITYFLLSDEVRLLASAGRARNTFIDVEAGVYGVSDLNTPEAAVAYDMRHVIDFWSTRGFEIKGIFPGKWAGRLNSYSGQDIVIVEKRP